MKRIENEKWLHLVQNGELPSPGVALDSIPEVYFTDIPSQTRSGVRTPEEFIAERRKSGLVLSFSGYASGGFPYLEEAAAIEQLFLELQARNRPVSLAIHGATKYGIPAISNAVASFFPQIARMGCVPERGLKSLAEPPVDYLEVKGKDYGDETERIGAEPDYLFVFGGGPNAKKEVEAAIAHGRKVALCRVKTYPSSSVSNNSEILSNGFGRVSVLDGPEDLLKFVKSI